MQNQTFKFYYHRERGENFLQNSDQKFNGQRRDSIPRVWCLTLDEVYFSKEKNSQCLDDGLSTQASILFEKKKRREEVFTKYFVCKSLEGCPYGQKK